MKKFFASTVMLLLVWGAAQAVSHIGKGRLTIDGFSATANLPGRFQLLENTSAGMLHLVGPLNPQAKGFDRQSLLARPYAMAYPDLQLSRDEIVQHFTGKKWKLTSRPGECVTVLETETQTTISSIAVWGRSKGTVVSGSRSEVTRKAIRDLLNSLSVAPEDCSWK